MLSLYRQKTVIIVIFLFTIQSLLAQENIKFQPEYDAKKIHFGYFLGLASTSYQVRFNSSFIGPTNNGKVLAITSPSTTGIKAGGIINVHLNDYFDFRFSPLSVAIYNRKILESDSIVHKQEDKAWFEIPLLLKYKSERRKNTRMFLFGGLKYGFETNIINRRGGVSSRNILFTKTSDLTLDYGFGLELFREYFKVTPEIHFSHGLKNMKAPGVPASSYMQYVERLRTHSVTFFLVFQ
jgi:hypothetical protein